MASQFKYAFFFFYCSIYSVALCGQIDSKTQEITFTIPEISLLDAEPHTSSIELPLTPPIDAGNGIIVGSSNQSKWLNYTVSLGTSANRRSISAQITGGMVPTGLEIQLEAANYTGTGAGAFGTSTGTISLSTTAQAIINGIGGSYTGNGVNNGHLLTFTLMIADYAAMKIGVQQAVEITYTITEQ